MQIPEQFVSSLERLGSVAEGLADAIANTAPQVSVRFNRCKSGAQMPDAVAGCPTGDAVPWCPEGVYLDERPQFTPDPLLHAGCYYVQDASSMIIAHVVRHLTEGCDRPIAYLDACAAPGGKTTAAISALPTGSLIVANEYDGKRAMILAENIVKWGYPDVMVTRGDTARLTRAGVMFDIVGADVPCSGEGMMRKEAAAVAQWSPGLVAECAALQRSILGNLVPLVRPGGYLIYSTCTYNIDENERNVEYLMSEYGMELIEIPSDPSWGIAHGVTDSCAHALRFMPHMTRGEGLFMAVLRRPADVPTLRMAKPKNRKAANAPIPKEATAIVSPMMLDTHRLRCDGQSVTLIPRTFQAERTAIADACDVIADGVAVGSVKGRDLIPAHACAMVPGLVSDSIPRVDLSHDRARDYLRREAVTLPDGTPRGHVIVTYAGHPLGWMKNLGNRANNLYPAEYRIRNL